MICARRMVGLIGAAVLLSPVAALAHDEVHFAHDGAGRLAIDLHMQLPVLMPESPYPEFPGFVTVDLGMVALDVDEPDKGLFVLDPSSSIDITLVSIDPELGFWTGGGYLGLNETHTLGHPYFHLHFVYHASPAAKPGHEYQMTFVASDSTGLYQPSEPFTLVFMPFDVCTGDVNLDGHTDQADLGILLAFYGQSVPPNSNGDLDGDGQVGQADLGILLADYGCGHH
ncbi:MAG: hypothetical protein LC135_07775 [Phycisphaerae bacterium]|jgi:hypothetical protein|nr:hypothetical protein [Phycisphaerae bacterium]MCZ2399753.1 hypothetical protein [Phycisphaerae bacterium]NUQ49455.1 hypothetical protein [Phycisphaerae bacterium]